MTLFQITRHQCWKPTREPRRPQESDQKESDMRFHSLTKCIWAMPSAPRKQQTYFSAWPQRPQDLQQSRAPQSPRQRHAFSQRLKTHLAMHSAPRQQTYSSPKAPRAPRLPNGHPAFFTASNTHLSHAHPVQGTKGPKTATCVFPDSQNAFRPIPSAPRQQTCNLRFHGPQNGYNSLPKRI